MPLTVVIQLVLSPFTSAGRMLMSMRTTPGIWVAATSWRQCHLRPAKSVSPSELPVGAT